MNFLFFSYLDYAIPKQIGFQSPASPLMDGLINLHHQIMFFLVFVIVFVFSMLFLILQDFSINNIDSINDYLKTKSLFNIDIRHNSIIEIIWTIIPTFILFLIALPSFSLLYGFELFMDSYVTVKVIGNQWYWSYETIVKLKNLHYFNYNQSFFLKNIHISFDSYMVSAADLKQNELRLLETTNPLVLPTGTYIRLYATASDVLHSWAVPSLGVKVDCVPGRLNEVMLFINRVGRFYGQCSEICGVNHGFMPITVYGIDKVDFIIYCSSASDNLTNYLFFDLFLKDLSINCICTYDNYDFIYKHPAKINSYLILNLNKNFIDIIKKY